MPVVFVGLIVAAGQVAVPPPSIRTSATPALQRWVPSQARCGGRVEAAVALHPPMPRLLWAGAGKSMMLRFRIDPSGRPLAIMRTPNTPVYDSSDVVPSLAASRFAAGADRPDCTLIYVAEVTPIKDAPLHALIAYSALPTGQRLSGEGWSRILNEGGATCGATPRPDPLLRAYPSLRTIPATPGVRDWAVASFDLDRSGHPKATRVVAGSGNAALDRAAVQAIRASRFTPGARTGCLFPYYRAPATLTAPPAPSEDSVRPANANCPAKLPFVRKPRMVAPSAYASRRIEGWAMLAYDVAPWGAIGNVRVLAAEPSGEFGDWAKSVIGFATKPAGTTGYVGCVDKVVFRMPDDAAPDGVPEEPSDIVSVGD